MALFILMAGGSGGAKETGSEGSSYIFFIFINLPGEEGLKQVEWNGMPL